jgi:hypothetical protein
MPPPPTDVDPRRLLACAEKISALIKRGDDVRTKANRDADVDGHLWGGLGLGFQLPHLYRSLRDEVYAHLDLMCEGLTSARQKLVFNAEQYSRVERAAADSMSAADWSRRRG